jgi:hypothetical protein
LPTMNFLKSGEEVLWQGRPKMSIPLAIATTVGLVMVLAAFSSVFLPILSPESAVIVFLISIFVTMPSWQFFLRVGCRYYVTNQRVVIVRGEGPGKSLAFDNIEFFGRNQDFPLGSWHVDFVAADGSDIDSFHGGKPLRWMFGFRYLWRKESKIVEQLVKDRILPVPEPRVYRCMGCSFQGKTEDELHHHISEYHGGSVT